MRTPRTKPSQPIPTNGHPTRKAAVIELYEAGVQQKEIVKRLGCTRNAVSQIIFDYRQKTGRYIEPKRIEPPKEPEAPLIDIRESPGDWCWLNYRKSVAGARAALEAMGL